MTVPKRVRDYLGFEPGTEVKFRRAADGSIVIERADGTRPPSRFAKVIGCAGPGPSTDEIMVSCVGNRKRLEDFSYRFVSCVRAKQTGAGSRTF